MADALIGVGIMQKERASAVSSSSEALLMEIDIGMSFPISPYLLEILETALLQSDTMSDALVYRATRSTEVCVCVCYHQLVLISLYWKQSFRPVDDTWSCERAWLLK